MVFTKNDIQFHITFFQSIFLLFLQFPTCSLSSLFSTPSHMVTEKSQLEDTSSWL